MAKKKEEKQKFGDIIENHDLIKRTLMVSAFPALIRSVVKEGDTLFEGFLPGFEFANIEDMASEDECVEYLQDMLDDEVEELVVFGKSLPFVEEDETLLKQYPDHKIVYLDINVYATKEELEYYDSCSHNCSTCGHKCGEEEFYDDEFFDDDCCDDDCCDDDCGCGHLHHNHYSDDECCDDDDCTCGDDDCNCGDDECGCGDDCNSDDGCCDDADNNNGVSKCNCNNKDEEDKSSENNKHSCKCGKHNNHEHNCKCEKPNNNKHDCKCKNKKEDKLKATKKATQNNTKKK